MFSLGKSTTSLCLREYSILGTEHETHQKSMKNWFKNCVFFKSIKKRIKIGLGSLLGSIWEGFGRVLGPSWTPLGASWALLGASWPPLGRLLDVSWTFLGSLGRFLCDFGAFRRVWGGFGEGSGRVLQGLGA